jgi:cyclopropane-fatty-acyl-phospholipid synthase
MLLARLLNSLVKQGAVTMIDPAGASHRIGGPPGPGTQEIAFRIHDNRTMLRIAVKPTLRLGEAYMDGSLTMESGSIYDLLDLFARNLHNYDSRGRIRLYRSLYPLLRLVEQYNPMDRSRRNVAHHYDLSSQLYDLFLDRDRQYSCAYFAEPGMDIDEAQEAKKRHIAAKLLLQPGQRVLDIGCGWGGLALYLNRVAGVEVDGITLSVEQHKMAQARAEAAGVADRVRFHLCDYRAQTGRYDRIVSVGMFEHVGTPHYRGFFDKVRDLLTDDGVALVHSIGQSPGPGSINPWMRKYIFPGSYTPALSEVMPAIEGAGLVATDLEILRLHYAETLLHWRQRFMARRQEAVALYDERFCRMWEFYLALCEVGFRRRGLMVFQVQLARHQEAVPLTRDYLVDWEREQAGLDAKPQLVERAAGTTRSREPA